MNKRNNDSKLKLNLKLKKLVCRFFFYFLERVLFQKWFLTDLALIIELFLVSYLILVLSNVFDLTSAENPFKMT